MTTLTVSPGPAPAAPTPARPGPAPPKAVLERVPAPGPGETRVSLDGQTVGGLVARYAEWVDGVGRLVATGEGPWTDTTGVFALDPQGRPTGPVDLTSSVRLVGLPIATVRSVGAAWDGVTAVAVPTVAVDGPVLRVSGGTIEVQPGLVAQDAPTSTEIALPPTLAALAAGVPAPVAPAPRADPEGDASVPDAAPENPLAEVPTEAAAPAEAAPTDALAPAPDVEATTPELTPAASSDEAAPAEPVELLMPPAPTVPGPEQQARMGGVSGGAGRAAGRTKDLPPAGPTTDAARGAVNEPQAEANARASADLAAALGNAPAPSPEILQLCDKIRTAITERRPADEDELTKADIKGAAKEAGGTLDTAVQGDTQRVQSSYAPLQDTPTAAPASGTPVTTPDPSVADPGIGAPRAAPDPVPDANLSLEADKNHVETMATDSRIERHSTEPLQQTPPYSEVRANRDELAGVAATGPPDVAGQQAAAISQAQADMAGLQKQALQALGSSRGGTVRGVAGGQQGMVGQETQTRESVSREAQSIFTDTQTKVQALLEPLSRTAMARWDAETERLSREFKSHLDEVQKWIDERHSGASGFVVGLWDAVTGLPGWVTREYDDAERRFGDGVCDVLKSISTDVNSVIGAAQALIADARDRTKTLFANLPENLKAWAVGEQAKFDAQLDGLARQAEKARTSFVTDISQRALTAMAEVQAQVEELRKKAGGLVGRIVAAIEAFIDDPIKAIINGLLSLLGIAPAAFWALVEKIGEVIDGIADDPEGFANNLVEALRLGFQGFFDRFGEHLAAGFWTWLFSRCKSVGVQLPRDASLGSIITFVLQIMGITWPRIREILVRQVGAKNVEIIEQVWGLVSLLIQKGPGGVVEMLKEQLNPETIINAVVEAAVEFAVQALIERVALRLLAMLNPAGAVLQAIELIYKVLRWVVDNAARIFALVETVVNAAADILAGNFASVAVLIEKALASLIPLVIDLLAGMIGLGDLPDQVAAAIGRLQEMVLPIVERVIVALVTQGKALLAALGLGGSDDKKKAGGGDEDLGTTVRFTSAGEAHRVWVETTGSSARVMVASMPGPVATKIGQWRAQVAALPESENEKKTKATSLLDQLVPLVSTTDEEAASLKPQFDAATLDTDPATQPPSDDALESEERQVADLLDQLFTLLEEKPDPDAIIARYAPFIPGNANRRVDDALLTWASSLQGIEVGPVGQRQPLFADPLSALVGLSGAEGGAVLSDHGHQLALVPFFTLAGRERDPASNDFYDFVFVALSPRPPHRVRRAFLQAVGDAAVGRIRSYVTGQLPSLTLSDDERAKITESLAEVTFVLSATSPAGRFDGLRSREPDHAFFMPKEIQKLPGNQLRYDTVSGQSFVVDTSGGLPTKVVGSNLTQFIGRGVTQDSPYYVKNQDFNRAHVIANRFGGSGYRSAQNLVTTSKQYNQVEMAGAENRIAKHIDAAAGVAETKVRATFPPQAAVVTFTLTVQLTYLDAIVRLIEQALAQSLPDKSAAIEAEILKKLEAAKIDRALKRVTSTAYDLSLLKVAGSDAEGTEARIEEDVWLLSEMT